MNHKGLVVPAFGQVWPGEGGINLGPHALGGFLIGAAATVIFTAQFGGYGKRIAGADSLIDGAANTAALLASGTEHPAAAACAAYTTDGHSDYYLGAQREIMQRYALALEQYPDKKVVEWSSTQDGSLNAWAVGFEYGGVSNWGKDGEFQARPVRRLII